MRRRSWIALGSIVAIVVLAVASEPLLDRLGAHSIVDAPNAHHEIEPRLDGELTVAVGPPAATLAYSLVEPTGDRATSPRGLIFLLHGIRSHKEAVIEWAQHLAAGGYRCVLVDSRGHGRSTGEWLTYGVQESRDLSQLLDALHAPPSLPVGVMGTSYGAATAIEWAGREPRVRGAVALAPFSSLRDIVPVYTPRTVPVVGRFLPASLIQRTVNAAGELAHFDPDQASPLMAITLRDVPILIFHGTQDAHIPLSQSQALHDRAPSHVQLVILDGQDHLHIPHDARLWPAVLDFFNRVTTSIGQ